MAARDKFIIFTHPKRISVPFRVQSLSRCMIVQIWRFVFRMVVTSFGEMLDSRPDRQRRPYSCQCVHSFVAALQKTELALGSNGLQLHCRSSWVLMYGKSATTQTFEHTC